MDLYPLVNYKFLKTNVTYSDLPRDLVIVHLGYNLDNPESLIVFNQVYPSRNKLLTEASVTDYYKVVDKKFNSKKRFEIKGNPPYTIVLCYDNGENLESCTYTLSEMIENIDSKTVIPIRDNKYEIITPEIEKAELDDLKELFLEIPSIVDNAENTEDIISKLKHFLEENEEEYLRSYLKLAPSDKIQLLQYVKDYFYTDFEISVGEFK
jgi:hypothetical protein